MMIFISGYLGFRYAAPQALRRRPLRGLRAHAARSSKIGVIASKDATTRILASREMNRSLVFASRPHKEEHR